MSDSEDSESFLSADEGGEDAGNESSDITLSSDSEPEEGGKAVKATPGDPDSSDITLSSDDDEKCAKSPAKATPKKELDAVPDVKTTQTSEHAAQEKISSGKTSQPIDSEENVKQKPSPKPGQDVDDKSSFSLSGVASALSSSTQLDTKEKASKQNTADKAQTPDADMLESTETSLKKASAKETTVSCSSTLASPIPEVSQSQTTSEAPSEAPAPAQAAAEPKGECESSAATHDAEGWDDVDEDLTLPDDPAAGAAAEKPTSSRGWSADLAQSTQSAPPAESESTAPRPQTPPPSSEPAAAPSSAEPVTLPSKVTESPSEPAASPSEPVASPSEPAVSPSEPAPERKRPERRERRGPLKLGAKKLGAKLAAPPSKPDSEVAASAGSGASQPDSGGAATSQPDRGGAATSQPDRGGAATSPPAPAPASAGQQEEQDGWGSWETWGSSLLSSAADVTKVVLETVETGFGAPDPEDLARIAREEQQQERQEKQEQRQKQQEEQQQEQQEPTTQAAEPAATDPGLGLGSWFGGVSRVLGHTSSLVVNTGLDTLEAIGKKTMHVLQDDQLGIHGTISQLGGQKPSLSQALREARQKRGDAVPGCPAAATGDPAAARPPTFSHMFDQCDGTAHLEALEMLSGRCRSRVAAAKSRADEAAGILLDMLEELCTPDELEEVEVSDFEAELSALVARLSVPIKPTRLIIAQSSARQWLDSRSAAEPAVPLQVLGRAVRAAAEVGAGLAEFLHKVAELRLVAGGGGGGGEPVAAARHLAALAALVSAQAAVMAAGFAATLSGQPDERAAAATTDIYLEVSYLQKFCIDSLHLMAPVLQMAALNDKS